MAANDYAAQNGTEKISTNLLSTVNGTNVTADLIEVQRFKAGWGADGVLNDTSTATPMPVAQPDITTTGTVLLLNDAVTIALNGDGSWSADLTGFAGHVITFESLVNSGGTWRPINGALQGVGTIASTATTDGTYRGAAAALSGIRARLSTIGTGMVTANLRASVTTAGVFQLAPIPAGGNLIGGTTNNGATKGTTTAAAITSTNASANRQPMDVSLYDSATGNPSVFRADGQLYSASAPVSLLYDNFEALDTTNIWATGGTAPTASLGNLVFNAGTAANAASYLFSKATFSLFAVEFIRAGALVQLAAAAETGSKACWGQMTIGSPTLAVPTSNGVVFEIQDTDGALVGVVYSNGVRGTPVSLTRPTDGGIHRYAIFYRSSRAYFEIDSVTVGSIAFPNPLVSKMPLAGIVINGASTLGAARTITTSLYSLADTGRNSLQISDGTYSWTKLTVKPPSTAAIAADTGAVVALHPSSPLPTGANTIGTVNPPAITKGTQGSNGFAVQNLKDAGRSARTISLDSFAVAATTETLNTMSYSSDNGTLTTGTSYTVTTAKRFRLQAISVGLHTITGNTTAVAVLVRIRVNNAGAATVTSPMQMIIPVSGIAAANQNADTVVISIPDGWEFIAGAGIGVTTTCAGFVATTAAPKVDIALIGYEY